MDSAKDSDESSIYKRDPINELIIETLRKKPVNSEYFSVLKRIKPGNRVRTRDLDFKVNQDTVSERSKNYLSEVGFTYGRLHYEDALNSSHTDRARIRAPGPLLEKKESPIPIVKFKDKFKPRAVERFYDYKPIIEQKTESVVKTRYESTDSKMPNLSPSQNQAKEFLKFLNVFSPEEKRFINSQVSNKFKMFAKDLEISAEKEMKMLDKRGMFNSRLNRLRVQAMIEVKKMHKRSSLSPVIKTARQQLEITREITPVKKTVFEFEGENTRQQQVLKKIEGAVAKKIVRNKRRQSIMEEDNEWNYNPAWSEDIHDSVLQSMKNCRPDSRITNLNISNLNKSYL